MKIAIACDHGGYLLKQDILINEVCKGEEDNDEPDSFIKNDD